MTRTAVALAVFVFLTGCAQPDTPDTPDTAVGIARAATSTASVSPTPVRYRCPAGPVYHPDRLVQLGGCRTITATVASVRPEADGDLHVRLKLAAKDTHLLAHSQAFLIAEPVCVGNVTQADAVSTCAGRRPPGYTPPRAGQRVRVTGRWVLDKIHGWNELHPARITVLP